MLKTYVVQFRAKGDNHEIITFNESITEAVQDARQTIKAKYGDHKIQKIEELTGIELERWLSC